MNALTGQAEFNGTSIVDVTDPKAPKYLHHVPGEEALRSRGAQMMRICSGKGLSKGDPNHSTCCACSAIRRTRYGM